MIRAWSTALLLVVCGAVGCQPGAARAQEPAPPAESASARRIALDEALRRVEAGNLELRLARSEVAAAEARVLAAGTVANPGLSASREQLSDEDSDYHETTLTLGQVVEIGGKRGARREAARRLLEAAHSRLRAERTRIAFAVHRAYVEAAVAEANLSIIDEATQVVRRVEQSGGVRFAEGDISRFDRSRLQVERARYETLLARTRLNLDEASRELALLVAPVAAEGETALLPADPLATLTVAEGALTLEAALGAALERPEVRAAGSEVEAARASLSLSRRARVPDLTVSGGYKRQADGLHGAVVGLSLPVPLWNRNQGEIAAAEAEIEAALARQDLAVARARHEIRRAWETHRSLQERMRGLGEVLVPESAGLLETARLSYAEGEMSLLELLDAADAYRSARESVNRLLGDYLVSLYDLRRATGTLHAPASAPIDAPTR
ncbi:MAG TPA: TolC family protein [Longimicrobiaceae bacterium]